MNIIGVLVATIFCFIGGAIVFNSYVDENGRGFGTFGGLAMIGFGIFFNSYCQTFDAFFLYCFIICAIISAVCLIIKKMKG